jgi:hypothetical protein
MIQTISFVYQFRINNLYPQRTQENPITASQLSPKQTKVIMPQKFYEYVMQAPLNDILF